MCHDNFYSDSNFDSTRSATPTCLAFMPLSVVNECAKHDDDVAVHAAGDERHGVDARTRMDLVEYLLPLAVN